MEEVQNIFFVGRNYLAHIKELKNQVPIEPVWFMKPTHSIVWLENETELNYPRSLGEIHYETELFIQLKADYHPDADLADIIGGYGVGLDLTLRNLQSSLKDQGLPWLRGKGFKQSTLLSKQKPFVSEQYFAQGDFSLLINGILAQLGEPQLMITPLPQLMENCWQQFGLRKGDILFTGTPAGVGKIHSEDILSLYLENEEVAKVRVLID